MKEKEIGAALKAFFHEKGITQKQLSEELGVFPSYINALFSGNRAFGKKQALLFQEKFGISSSWLLTGEGEMFLNSTINANNSTVVGANINGSGNHIQHNDLTEMMNLLKKKDEQIDRLLGIIEKTK